MKWLNWNFTCRLTDIDPLCVHGCFLYRPTTPQCNCFYSWSTAVVFVDCIKYRLDYYNLFALQVSFHTLCHYVILKSRFFDNSIHKFHIIDKWNVCCRLFGSELLQIWFLMPSTVGLWGNKLILEAWVYGEKHRYLYPPNPLRVNSRETKGKSF